MFDIYHALDFLLDKLAAGQIGHDHHGERRHRGYPDDDFFKVAWQYAHLPCHEQYPQSASSNFIFKWLNLAMRQWPRESYFSGHSNSD